MIRAAVEVIPPRADRCTNPPRIIGEICIVRTDGRECADVGHYVVDITTINRDISAHVERFYIEDWDRNRSGMELLAEAMRIWTDDNA